MYVTFFHRKLAFLFLQSLRAMNVYSELLATNLYRHKLTNQRVDYLSEYQLSQLQLFRI